VAIPGERKKTNVFLKDKSFGFCAVGFCGAFILQKNDP
jgi:hypothetical protein